MKVSKSEKTLNLSRILIADVGVAQERLTDNDDSEARRSVIRAQFAAIEGFAWMFRQEVIEAASQLDLIAEKETKALSEVVHSVSASGRISTQEKYVPTLSAFRLSARIAQRICKGKTIDFAGVGWSSLRQAMQIRNRITHPKLDTDLEISRIELDQCDLAFLWFVDTVLDTLEAVFAVLRDEVAGFTQLCSLLENNDPVAWGYYQSAMLDIIDE